MASKLSCWIFYSSFNTCLSFPFLEKKSEKCPVYLGITQIAFDPTPTVKQALGGTFFLIKDIPQTLRQKCSPQKENVVCAFLCPMYVSLCMYPCVGMRRRVFGNDPAPGPGTLLLHNRCAISDDQRPMMRPQAKL